MNEAEFHPIKALGWNTKQKLIMKTRAEWLAVLEEQEGETSFEAGWIGSSTSESWSRESIKQKLENSTSSRIRFTIYFEGM